MSAPRLLRAMIGESESERREVARGRCIDIGRQVNK
jgi:hypothetical protein